MTTDTDKLVETALNDAYEKGWCAAAQWANRDDLRHDTGSIAYEGQRDAILSGNAAGLVASLCADVEPVAFMFQHSETGRIAFVDAWQKENGWALANPRYSEVGTMHGASTVASLTAQRDAALARVAELEKDAARWRFSMWYQQEHLKNPSLRCEAIDELYRSRVELSADNYTAAIDKAITSTPDYDAALTKGQP